MRGEFPVTKIFYELEKFGLLPGILFRTSRRQCDFDITKLTETRTCQLPAVESNRIKAEIESVIQKYNMDPQVIKGHAHYGALIRTGAGAHHAGQLLVWRLLLEELMSRAVLRVMIATGTVAAGVDFPARTVVIAAHSKRGSEGFNVLTSAEFQQMAGRAGRRGKDAVGICLVAPGPYSDARIIQQVSRRPPEPLRSAYFAAPSTVLNLLKYRNVDDLRYTVSRSLASFLDRKAATVIRLDAAKMNEELKDHPKPDAHAQSKAIKRIRRREKEAVALEAKQEESLNKTLGALEALGYIERGGLTAKGQWAANLCTTLVLELAEAIDSGLFDDLSVDELVCLVSSISGDSHRTYLKIRKNPLKTEYFKELQEILNKVRANYVNPAADEVEVVDAAALTMLTWIEAGDWAEFSSLLRLAGVAEGDVARLVTQTAEHLNQLSRLTESHPALAAAAIEGRMKILRPPLIESLVVEMTANAV